MSLKTKIKIKFLVVLLTSLFSAVFMACNSEYTAWEDNQTVNGIEFKIIRYRVTEFDTLSVIGFLKNPTIIEQYNVAANWVHFTKEWKLEFFKLASKAVINNFEYDEGSWIRFTKEKEIICVFPENKTIYGYNVIGGGGSKGVSTKFYKSGRLQQFFSVNDCNINGIECRGDVFSPISLYEDGKLKECVLAKETVFNGLEAGEGAWVEFDVNGNLESITSQ